MIWIRGTILLTGVFAFAPSCHGKPMSCKVEPHPNGSISYILHNKPEEWCLEQWSSNNTVIALNEGSDTDWNKSLVFTLGKNFITLNTCLDTMTYRRDCPMNNSMIHCLYNCSAKDSPPPVKQGPDSKLKKNRLVAFAAVAVFLAVVMGLVIISCYVRKSCPGTELDH